MQKYLDLIQQIKDNGEYKSPARDNMPSTKSIFGYQFRHDLSKGFPLLTTKKMFWKGIVYELLWFLRGDTNIKYLVDNGVGLWNRDSYNYYIKMCKENNIKDHLDFDGETGFVSHIKQGILNPGSPDLYNTGYKYGDCGYQYGKVWRKWYKDFDVERNEDNTAKNLIPIYVDQIQNLIQGLKNTPESRRHILTAIDPAHSNDLALYWCHVLAQFNCRLLSLSERMKLQLYDNEQIKYVEETKTEESIKNLNLILDGRNIPKYKLDCHLYQRSADVFLGVPLNIASYSLLTHIFAKICNMIPGDFIHTFGDVHIYDNHETQINTQLERTPLELPTLKFSEKFFDGIDLLNWRDGKVITFDNFINDLNLEDFILENYNSHPAIKADLSTGMK